MEENRGWRIFCPSKSAMLRGWGEVEEVVVGISCAGGGVEVGGWRVGTFVICTQMTTT